jgi:hypothetical protein
MNDPSANLPVVDPAGVLPLQSLAVAPALDPDASDDARLPPDHPQWQRDVISLSSRTRAILASVVPTIVRTFSYWDHTVRTLILGPRTLSIDPAGCYRLR